VVFAITAYILACSLTSDLIAYLAYDCSDFCAISIYGRFHNMPNFSAKLISRDQNLQGSVGEGMLSEMYLHS